MEKIRLPPKPGTAGPVYATVGDLETKLGSQLRLLRLDQNLRQETLAQRAGVSLNSLKRLELGRGSTTHTILSVLRALGREGWLETIAPVATINPLTMTRAANPRQRARKV